MNQDDVRPNLTMQNFPLPLQNNFHCFYLFFHCVTSLPAFWLFLAIWRTISPPLEQFFNRRKLENPCKMSDSCRNSAPQLLWLVCRSSKIPRAWPWTTDRPWHCYGDDLWVVIGSNLGRVFADWLLNRKQVPGTWLVCSLTRTSQRSKTCRQLHLTSGQNQKDFAHWSYRLDKNAQK